MDAKLYEKLKGKKRCFQNTQESGPTAGPQIRNELQSLLGGQRGGEAGTDTGRAVRCAAPAGRRG